MQTIELSLPGWCEEIFKVAKQQAFPTLEERMRFVIALQRQNIENDSGGPFAAAIFACDSGQLVSIGVNCVVPQNCCCAHAEMMAFMQAGKILKNYDLADAALPSHQLVTSGQMCVMCFGATIWSGIKEVAYAATAEDIQRINGFDEGPLPENWSQELQQRGIQVFPEILRAEALSNHELYKSLSRPIYNSER